MGVGHAVRPIAGLRAVCEEGGVLDEVAKVANVGGFGFGQTDEHLPAVFPGGLTAFGLRSLQSAWLSHLSPSS